MIYTINTTIMGPSRLNGDAFGEWLVDQGAPIPEDARAYGRALDTWSPIIGVRGEVAAGQSLQETYYPPDSPTRKPLNSRWARERRNYAGMGVTGDPVQNEASPTFATVEAFAIAQLLHLRLYANGLSLPDGRPELKNANPRRQNAIDAGYVGQAPTIKGLANTWAKDPAYATGIVAHMNRLEAAGVFTDTDAGGVIVPDPTTGDTAVSSTWTKDNVYVIVTMGHRSDNDAGDPAEKAKTQYNAIADQKAFRAAGFRCDIWQQDLDGDGRPTMTTGGLDTVALGVGKAMKAWIAKNPTGLVILIDDHYNGPSSPVHVIVPDVGGMGTAYAGGAPGDDTAANNTLDYALALAIAANISKATGMPLLAGRFGANGVMSEQDTGVGITYNARLAMMAATAPYRANAIRLVVEHGGYNDPAAKKDSFYATCATAKVQAVQAVLGIAAGQGDGTGGATPPTPLFTPAVAVPELAAYIGKGDTIAALPPAGVKAANGVIWNPAGYNVATIEETARLAGDSLTSGSRGPNIPKDHEFGVLAWGVGTDGNLLYLTPGLTRVDARKVRIAAPGVLSKAA